MLRVTVPMLLLAVAALAQTPPPVAPTVTPTPAPAEAAGTPTVRSAAPSDLSALEIAEPRPANPIDAVAMRPLAAGEADQTKGEFVIAPIPISDPALGTGLGVTAVFTFLKSDADDPSPSPRQAAAHSPQGLPAHPVRQESAPQTVARARGGPPDHRQPVPRDGR